MPVSKARQWYLKALLPAHSLNRLWLSHGAPEKDMEQKKMEDPQGMGAAQRSCAGERKCVIKFTRSAEQVITELIKQGFLTQ